MDYLNYTIEDLLLDESFKDWVLARDEASKKAWDNYINSHSEERGIIEEAYFIIQMMEANKISIKQEKINTEFEEIKEYYQDAFTKKEKTNAPTTSFRINKITKIAASFLIFILLGITSYYLFTDKEQVSEYITENNQIKEINLPDGSVVFLNQNSRLIFNNDWQKNHLREVTLFGEAYFQVSKTSINNEKIKFAVQSGDLRVEVLGTEFNVNNIGVNTTVALNSGKVRLTNQKSSLSMQPGEVIEYQSKRQHFVKKTESTRSYTSWLNSIPNNPTIQSKTSEQGSNRKAIKNSNNNQQPRTIQSNKKQEKNTQSQTLDERISKNPGSGTNHNAGVRNVYERRTQAHKTEKNEGAVSSYYITEEKVQVPAEKANKAKIFQNGENNEAFIEQIGEGLKSKQVQEGKNNKASAQFEGKNSKTSKDDHEWSTYQEQHGEGNVSIFHVMESYNSNLYSLQKGKGNVAKADVEGEENILFILQEGRYNEVNAIQDGNYNKAGLSPLDPGVMQKGNLNEADIIQQGFNNNVNINQHGDNNKTNINQNDKKSF